MLPEGWKRCALGEIAQVTSGGTPDRSEPSYWGGAIPWVTTGEIRFNTITDTTEKITEAGLKNSSAKLFPPGSLLMAMYGQGKTRGQVAKLGIEAATNQACAAILLNQNEDTEFFFQFLASHYEAIRELGNAGTQKNLSGALIKEISVPVPPKREQEKIARVLVTWDEAIAATEKLLANSRKQKQILVTILLKPDPSWRNATFGEIFQVANYKNAQIVATSYQDSGALPIVDQGQTLIAGYTNDTSVFVAPPVIVFGDHTRIVKWIDFPFRPGADGTQLLRPIGGIHPKLAYHLLASAPTPNLGYSRHMRLLKTMRFAFPAEMAAQTSITDALDVMDRIIAAGEDQLRKLREEKRALMQHLLTGKRRVCLPDSASEAAP